MFFFTLIRTYYRLIIHIVSLIKVSNSNIVTIIFFIKYTTSHNFFITNYCYLGEFEQHGTDNITVEM